MALRLCNIVSIVCLVCAVFVIAIRGYMGEHFFASQKDFYPPAGQLLAQKEKSFRFSVVADTGSQNRTLQRIIREIVKNNPAFILHLGDLVTYRTKEHMYWITDELDDKLHNIPMYLIPGNHDVKNKKGHFDKSNYRRVFGPSYYWFGYGNTMFIALDSSEEKISDEEWDFYKTLMKKFRRFFKYVILYTHIPPINPPDMPEHTLKKGEVAKMAEIIQAYPPDIILTGHVHYYSHQMFKGVPLYSVPTSGQYFVGPIKKFGYLDVFVDNQGIRVENHYIDKTRSAEFFEILFVQIFLGNKVRWIMFAFLFLACLSFVIGRIIKKRHFNQKVLN